MSQPQMTRWAAAVGYSPLAMDMLDFALDLYRQLRSTEGNIFFSPYSISTALAMTYAGARGRTADQMRRTLHFNLEQEHLHREFNGLNECLDQIERAGGVQLKIANALWPHSSYTFLIEYLGLVEKFYNTVITGLDYNKPDSARQTINAWVEHKTMQKINEFIPPGILNFLTRLVLTNAAYFKGNWARQFDPLNTKAAPFWVSPSESIPVSMMAQEAQYGYSKVTGLQILELPYLGDQLSMVLLLPDEMDGLQQLEQQLTSDNLVRWIWLASSEKREIELYFPRFKVICGFQLNKTLSTVTKVMMNVPQ